VNTARSSFALRERLPGFCRQETFSGEGSLTGDGKSGRESCLGRVNFPNDGAKGPKEKKRRVSCRGAAGCSILCAERGGRCCSPRPAINKFLWGKVVEVPPAPRGELLGSNWALWEGKSEGWCLCEKPLQWKNEPASAVTGVCHFVLRSRKVPISRLSTGG